MSMHDPVHRRRAHAEARLGEVVDEFRLRRVGARAREVEQLLLASRVENASARHGLRALVGEPPQLGTNDEAYDRGDADAEVRGHLSLGAVPTGAGFDDLLPKVQGIGGRHVVTSGAVPIHTSWSGIKPVDARSQ